MMRCLIGSGKRGFLESRPQYRISPDPDTPGGCEEDSIHDEICPVGIHIDGAMGLFNALSLSEYSLTLYSAT